MMPIAKRVEKWSGSDEVHTRATDCSTRGAPSYREEAPPVLIGFRGVQRHPPGPPRTIEPASINPNHYRQRGVYVDAGRSEDVEGEAVL